MSIEKLKNVLRNFKNNRYEYNKVVKSIIKYTPKDGSVLDVGCGYGQYLRPLSKQFPNIVGVEINDHIREVLKKEKLNILSPQEFQKVDNKFDTILMSHIIEHFYPDELIEMMDSYLNHLKRGGHLIIATPTLNSNFFIDFDHKRPYYPESIEEVFDGENQQVKSYSKNSLQILKVWYRRSRIQINKTSLQYNYKFTKNLITLINILFAILFRYSFQIIGRRSGWIGVLKKN